MINTGRPSATRFLVSAVGVPRMQKLSPPMQRNQSYQRFDSFEKPQFCVLRLLSGILTFHLQWGAADAEIKVASVETTALKGSPFRAKSRSVYGHTCYAYCQGFLPCLFLPFWSIHLHFFQASRDFFFLCWLWLTHDSCVGPQNKIGHPAGRRFPC